MKTCRKCEAEKHCSEFYKRNSNKDGLDNTCKACVLQDAAAKPKAIEGVTIERQGNVTRHTAR